MVAVGASAGGLHALKIVLGQLPPRARKLIGLAAPIDLVDPALAERQQFIDDRKAVRRAEGADLQGGDAGFLIIFNIHLPPVIAQQHFRRGLREPQAGRDIGLRAAEAFDEVQFVVDPVHDLLRIQIVVDAHRFATRRGHAAAQAQELAEAACRHRRRVGCPDDEMRFRLILVGGDDVIIESRKERRDDHYRQEPFVPPRPDTELLRPVLTLDERVGGVRLDDSVHRLSRSCRLRH